MANNRNQTWVKHIKEHKQSQTICVNDPVANLATKVDTNIVGEGDRTYWCNDMTAEFYFKWGRP